MLDHKLNFWKKERHTDRQKEHARQRCIIGRVSVFDIPERFSTDALGGGCYSIKKDKYCNGALPGHALNLVALKCMDSMSCLIGSFRGTEMTALNKTVGPNANDARGRINTAPVIAHLPISASA